MRLVWYLTFRSTGPGFVSSRGIFHRALAATLALLTELMEGLNADGRATRLLRPAAKERFEDNQYRSSPRSASRKHGSKSNSAHAPWRSGRQTRGGRQGAPPRPPPAVPVHRL